MFTVKVICRETKASYEFTVNRELSKEVIRGIEDALVLRCNLGDEECGDLFTLTVEGDRVIVSDVEEHDYDFVKFNFDEAMILRQIEPQPGGMWFM